MDAYAKLLDYGALGAILVILFIGIGYLCWWMLRLFNPPKDATSKGGILYEWINAYTESARRIGEVVPKISENLTSLGVNQAAIAGTQRSIGEGQKMLGEGQKGAAEVLGKYHEALIQHQDRLIGTLNKHSDEARPGVTAALESAATMASLRDAGIHACIVAEMALKKLGVLEEAQPSLDRVRAALMQKGT
jgi:hypothetical protein